MKTSKEISLQENALNNASESANLVNLSFGLKLRLIQTRQES